MLQTRALLLGGLIAVATWTMPARAIEVEVTTRADSLVGENYSFAAKVTNATGPVLYRWDFGDGVRTEFEPDKPEMDHVYTAPRNAHVVLSVTDEAGGNSDQFLHVVHYPLTEKRPTQSTTIVYDAVRNRIFNVNQDNDTISAVDPIAMMKVGELPVYKNPEALALAPNGKLWVLHRDDYAIAIVDPDAMQIEWGFRLPYASQPIGLAMSPTGDAAYVTLMAIGKLLKLNPETGEVLGEALVGPSPRGVSVSADGTRIFVTRFISPATGGEVVEVDATSLKESHRFQLAPDTTTMDGGQQGRGLPNYLFSVSLSPDGREAWVGGNKSNIFRGLLRPTQDALTQDNTVRPMVSVLDLAAGTESVSERIDLDDRNLPTFVEFSPLGNWGIVTLTGSNRLEVRDAFTKGFDASLTDSGLAPRGTVLGPDGRLFVQGSMQRSLVVYDLRTVLDDSDARSIKITDIPVVANEKLPPDVLLGKQIFNNSADGRMTVEGYLTCSTCHFDGGDDGQVYDFKSRGEGFRNTISLKGRRGSGQGNLLWSGAFDEAQDFEEEIRGLFNGRGFISTDLLAVGTRSIALGDPKKGLSQDLDALAVYLATLDHVDPSPFRNSDGTMTADAIAGKTLFGRLGCDFCHSGADYTDSVRGRLHDVGTLKPTSGARGGGPLLGLDTPSLVGVWQTAPYLHDGSAATLRDVLTTQNKDDLHGFTSSLGESQLDELVAFLQQIDGDQPIRRLPFEPPLPQGGSAGTGSAGATTGGANIGGTGTGGPSEPESGCACDLGRRQSPNSVWLLLATPLLVWLRRRRRSAAAISVDNRKMLSGAHKRITSMYSSKRCSPGTR